MKQTRLTKILGASLLCAASLGVAFAQTTTTTTSTDPVTGTTTTQQTTTSAAGNIVTYTPDSDYFMFRTASGAAPVRYYYNKDTAVVDTAGRVVSCRRSARTCRPPFTTQRWAIGLSCAK